MNTFVEFYKFYSYRSEKSNFMVYLLIEVTQLIGVKCIIYEKNNKKLIISINKESKIQYNDILKTINNTLVFKYLESLYRIIDKWQKEYINTGIIDRANWKLSILYTNGSKREYYGKSSYPTNFEAFERLNQKLIDEVQNEQIKY